MNVFNKKCILPSKRICLRLKSLRLAKKISLEQMEKCTKINKEYLLAIENCNFEKINAAGIYKKNFIKKYAQCLNEDPEPFIRQFENEEENNNAKLQTTKINKYQLGNLPLTLRYLLSIALIAIFIFYLFGHINNILRSPALTVITPQDGSIVNENTIIISGATEKETKVSINKESVKINEEGYFNQEIILSPGINTIIISAESKHGKITKQTLNIIFK